MFHGEIRKILGGCPFLSGTMLTVAIEVYKSINKSLNQINFIDDIFKYILFFYKNLSNYFHLLNFRFDNLTSENSTHVQRTCTCTCKCMKCMKFMKNNKNYLLVVFQNM